MESARTDVHEIINSRVEYSFFERERESVKRPFNAFKKSLKLKLKPQETVDLNEPMAF